MVTINQHSTNFEQQYKALFNHSNDGIILHDSLGNILDINPKALQMLGYSQEEVSQLNVQQLHSQEAVASYKTVFQAIMEQDETTFETLFCHRNGTVFPVEVYAKRLQINAKPLIQSIIYDLTERKAAENILTLQLKKERIISTIAAKVREFLDLQTCLQTTVNEVQQFLDTDRVVIYQFNPDWSGFISVETANEHCESVLKKKIHDPCFGESYIELYQQGRIAQINDIYKVGYKPCHVEFLEALQVKAVLCVPILRNQELWGLLIVHHCRGPRNWTSLEVDLLGQLATQIAISTQQAELYHQISTELNQRKHTEVALRQSATSIRNLCKIIANPTTTLTETLEELLSLGCKQFNLELGILTHVINNQSTIVAAHTDSKIPLTGIRFPLKQTYCEKTLQSNKQTPFSILSASQCLWKTHPGYTNFKIETYLGIPIWIGKRPYGSLSFSSQTPRTQDFSTVEISLLELMAQWIGGALEREQSANELAKTRDQALAATRIKSDFLANMSHEIRTPMNAIIGMTSLLLDTSLATDQQDFVESIRQGSESLLNIINNILDFSKVESGQLVLEKSPFNIRDCVSDVCHFLRVTADEKSLSLRSHINTDVPISIIGDVTRLRQVLMNLIDNAIKFTNDGYVRIAVTAQPVDNDYNLQFSIQDTGIGISADQQQSLFKPFRQLDSAINRKYEGTGLGLAICQQLVQIMGGRIWVESKVSQGSTFHFTVTVQAVHQETAQGTEKSLSSQPITIDRHLAKRLPLRILLAEDNHVNQKLAVQLLERMGYRIDVAGDGLEVISSLERQVYDVILMDIHMPEMDGITATKLIHEKWPDQRPRIIATTANAMSGDREKFLAAGMDDYISKPIHIGELVKTLEGCSISHSHSDSTIKNEASNLLSTETPTESQKTSGEETAEETTDEKIIYLDKNILEQTLAPLGGLTLENLTPFLEIYAVESPKLYDILSSAIRDQDAEQIEYAAHTLKSSSASLGLIAVQNLCQTIENESRAGNLALEKYIPKLEAALSEGMRLIQKL